MRNTLKITVLVLTVLMAASAMAWDGFTYFSGTGVDSRIILAWQANDESQVVSYEIYRSRVDSRNMTFVDAIAPQGEGAKYSYVDNTVFAKSTSSDYEFSYRIKVKLNDGNSFYSNSTTVKLGMLGVSQQTWGSIKAMFR